MSRIDADTSAAESPVTEVNGQEPNPRFHLVSSPVTVTSTPSVSPTVEDLRQQFKGLNKRLLELRTQLERERKRINDDLKLIDELLAGPGVTRTSSIEPSAQQRSPNPAQQAVDEQRKRAGAPAYDALLKRKPEWVWARDLSSLTNGSVKKALSWWIEQGVVEVGGKGPGTQYRAK